MRKIINLIILAAVMLMSGCGNEHSLVPGGNDQPKATPVNILLAPGLRSAVVGSHLDDTVVRLRIMMFQVSTGKLAVNELITNLSAGLSENIKVKTGKYHFVFIANENAEPASNGLTATLNGLTIGSAKLSDLQDLYFSINAFDTDNYIPMVQVIENVTVLGENTVLLAGNTTPEEVPWSIPLTRLGVRMDVSFALSAEQYDDLLNANNPPVLTFSNITDRVFLFNGNENRDAGTPVTRNIIFNAANVNKQDVMTVLPGNEPKVMLKFDRIIMPENMFTPKKEESNSMGMSIALGGNTSYTFKGKVGVDLVSASKDYTLPRNNYLDISASLRIPYIDMTTDVIPWNDKDQNIIADEQFYLKADKNKIKITQLSGNTVTIETDYDGSTGYEAGSTLAPGLLLPYWLSVTPGAQTVNNGVYKRTYTVSSEYSINANGVFYIQAGNIRYAITVQLQFLN